MVLNSGQELSSYTSSFLKEDDSGVKIHDEKKLREEGIDTLAYTAALSDDSSLKHEASVMIRKIAPELGINSSSIYEFYKAIGRGEVNPAPTTLRSGLPATASRALRAGHFDFSLREQGVDPCSPASLREAGRADEQGIGCGVKGFSVPAMNIRMINYDFSQVIFEEAQKIEAGAFIFEIARSEMKYCAQDPDEFSASVLAAAIKTGWHGPVFIQGDHYQFKKEIFEKNPQEEIDSIELLIKDSLIAQFYNIDIDASTLVDLSKEELSEQQRDNYEMTAKLTEYIRQIEPAGVTVAIGGEIGHIGGKNSTVGDFEAFMKGYLDLIGEQKGLTKVSVQTGTSHGGIPDENGKVIEVAIDFSVLKGISKVAREKYKTAGPVQHGASTLPENMFSKFVENDTVEVHLATEFQNIIMDSMPKDLVEKMHQWTIENCKSEREEGWNDTQFVYKLRKKSVGPFKKESWMLPPEDKEKIRNALAKKLNFLFESFNIAGTSHTVHKYIG